MISYDPVAATAQLARQAYFANRPQPSVSTYVNTGSGPGGLNAPGIGGPDSLSEQYGATAPNQARPRGGAIADAPGGQGVYFNKATGETQDANGRVVSTEKGDAVYQYDQPGEGVDELTGQPASMPGQQVTLKGTYKQRQEAMNLEQTSTPGSSDFDNGLRKIYGLAKAEPATVDYTVQEGDGSGFQPGATIPLKPADAARFITQGKAAAAKKTAQDTAIQARDDAQQARFKQQSDLQLAAIQAKHDLMLAEADVKAGAKQPEEARKKANDYYAAIAKADADAVNMAKDGVENLFQQLRQQPTSPTAEQQAELARRMQAQQAALEQRQQHADEAAAAKAAPAQAAPAKGEATPADGVTTQAPAGTIINGPTGRFQATSTAQGIVWRKLTP